MKEVSYINIIKRIKANFENISRTSEAMLILGQLFLLFLLLGTLAYIIFNLYIAQNNGAVLDLLLMGELARESSITALAIIWGGSLFIDYIEKSGNK